MLKYVAVRTLRLVATVAAVLVAAFVALRISGSPVDAVFPDGIDSQTAAQLKADAGDIPQTFVAGPDTTPGATISGDDNPDSEEGGSDA